MNPVLRLPVNTQGRDIIVADIHGEFKQLKRALKAIAFNESQDRLIIAGDLVDRGRQSDKAIDWIQKPYCFAVFGNHDAQYAFKDEYKEFSDSLVCLPPDPWFTEMSGKALTAFCRTLKESMYPAIEIETPKGLVGVVHGEVPEGLTWAQMRERLNAKDYDLFHQCMWSRTLAKKAIRGIDAHEQERYHLSDVSHVFHGHTPASKLDFHPYRLANRYYIDTCAYRALKPEKYPTAGITLFDVLHPEIPLYTTGHRALVYAEETVIER